MAVTVVTPWLNCPELIPVYADAVRGAAVVIIDQASEPDTAAALDVMVADLGGRLIRNDTNRHFAAANNQGLALVETDRVVFLNNDVAGDSRWLAAVERDVHPCGLYGPAAQSFDVDGAAYPYLEGWCLAGMTEDVRRIGGWNERDFPRAYAEDVEFCWRASRHGLTLYQTRWRVQHLSNYTNRRLPGAYDHADAQRETFRRMVREQRRRDQYAILDAGRA